MRREPDEHAASTGVETAPAAPGGRTAVESEPAQLALDLAPNLASTRQRRLGAPKITPANRDAARLLAAHAHWPRGAAALVGPRGAGKSRFLAAFLASDPDEAPGRRLDDVGAIAAATRDLGPGERLAIDDAEARLAGDPAAESALFHLLNRVAERGGRLLLASRTPPARWAVDLPDLASRLRALALARLEPPDDALLVAVIAERFAELGRLAPPQAVAAIAQTTARDAASARRAVDAVDHLASRLGRPVSAALARRATALEAAGEASAETQDAAPNRSGE